MKKLAFIFPGQGSQYVGLLSTYAIDYPIVNEIFSQASTFLGYNLWKICQEGPEELLNDTLYTQPALFTASVVLYRIWREKKGEIPQWLAGHSLGEYAALVIANALTFEDGLRLVNKRAQLMHEAVPSGVGAMAALIGLSDSKVNEICEKAAEGEILAAANYNAVGQVVIAGHTAAVERALILAKTSGAKIAKKIPVSVPSHCPLMKPAAEKLGIFLETITLMTPLIPVMNNVDARIEKEPAMIKKALVRQLAYPVRWTETIQHLTANTPDAFIECGPGKILTSLNKRITDVVTFSLGELSQLTSALIN